MMTPSLSSSQQNKKAKIFQKKEEKARANLLPMR
jgi:hypothetical protein